MSGLVVNRLSPGAAAVLPPAPPLWCDLCDWHYGRSRVAGKSILDRGGVNTPAWVCADLHGRVALPYSAVQINDAFAVYCG